MIILEKKLVIGFDSRIYNNIDFGEEMITFLENNSSSCFQEIVLSTFLNQP